MRAPLVVAVLLVGCGGAPSGGRQVLDVPDNEATRFIASLNNSGEWAFKLDEQLDSIPLRAESIYIEVGGCIAQGYSGPADLLFGAPGGPLEELRINSPCSNPQMDSDFQGEAKWMRLPTRELWVEIREVELNYSGLIARAKVLGWSLPE